MISTAATRIISHPIIENISMLSMHPVYIDKISKVIGVDTENFYKKRIDRLLNHCAELFASTGSGLLGPSS